MASGMADDRPRRHTSSLSQADSAGAERVGEGAPDPELTAELRRYERLYTELGARALEMPDRSEYRPNDLRAATLFAIERLGALDRLTVLELGA
jgi:hypothetical protein